jgi:hypothetical protein
LLALGAAAFVAVAGAADKCDTAASKKDVAWAKSGPHSWLANVEHKQDVELPRTWCHIWETHGIDRVQKGIDFGRVLFTGEGFHPAVGGIVPGSGFAGGMVYNFERASASLPVRFSGSMEARGSYNGSWTAGGKLDIFGSGNSPDDRHIHATLDAEHYELPQLTYFGLGNSSSLANESLFGLSQTTGGGHIDFPVPGGFFIGGGLAGLLNSTSPVPEASLPSIEQRFTPANTPGLTADTTYIVAGGGINWIHPVAPHLEGFSSALTTGFRWFHATSGPYSFRRIDAIWQNRYTPATSVGLGTISATARFIESWAPAGNSMPFYLQPTIGGTNINNVDVLRSYRDYRFRAPNVLAFQAEYRRTIWGPFAALGFYDVGRVAEQRSDIGIAHMRHSFGAGMIVQLGGLPVFKVYYAWAGSDGTHTTYTLNTNNFTFSAPGGVF